MNLHNSYFIIHNCLVREGGLEPPRLAALPPQSSASANFATPAKSCGLQTAKSGPRFLCSRDTGSERLTFERGILVPHGIGLGIDRSTCERTSGAIGIGGRAIMEVIVDAAGHGALVATHDFAMAVGHFIGAGGKSDG